MLMSFADPAHAGQGVTAPMRAVLEYLERHGDETVPGIARERGVSRQHIQVIVNDLVTAGLARRRDNPAHRRSRLVGLTAAGRTCIDDLIRVEGELLVDVLADLPQADLVTTHDTLRHRLNVWAETRDSS